MVQILAIKLDMILFFQIETLLMSTGTLEYLLAGANPEAASIASPESAIQEVW